jgi:hypothetical protein
MTTARDKFVRGQDMVIAQGRCVRQVTPSDANDLPEVTKSLLILTNGNICVEPVDGYFDNAGVKLVGGVVFTVTAGQEFDLIRVSRIYATNTTATMLAIS